MAAPDTPKACFWKSACGSPGRTKASAGPHAGPQGVPPLRTHCLLLEHARPPLFPRRRRRLLRRLRRGHPPAAAPLLHRGRRRAPRSGRPNDSAASRESASLAPAPPRPEVRRREARAGGASSLGAAAGAGSHGGRVAGPRPLSAAERAPRGAACGQRRPCRGWAPAPWRRPTPRRPAGAGSGQRPRVRAGGAGPLLCALWRPSGAAATASSCSRGWRAAALSACSDCLPS